MADSKPGDGFLGWLGRQIGHVKKAIQTKVEPPTPRQALAAPGAAQPASPQNPPPADPASPPPQTSPDPHVVYRDMKIEEIPMPDRPGILLRRTIIDEAIVDHNAPNTEASP